MKKRLELSNVAYYGGHPSFDKTADGAVVVIDDGGIHFQTIREQFVIPWSDVKVLSVDGPEKTEKRVVLARFLLWGWFAFAAKRTTTDVYLSVETAKYSVGFKVPHTAAAELRVKLSPWLGRLSGPQSEV